MPRMYGGGGFHHNARDGNFGDYSNALTPQDTEGDPNAQLLGLTTTGEAVQGGHTGAPADRGGTAPENRIGEQWLQVSRSHQWQA